jgi:valyl-tRNA synthetase
LYSRDKGFKSIHQSPWPDVNRELIDEEAERQGDLMVAVISEVRRQKAERHMPLNAEVKRLKAYTKDEDAARIIAEGKKDILGTCKIVDMEILPQSRMNREAKLNDNVRFAVEF